MRIAVTSTGPSLDDHVEARFGRCAYFLIVDVETAEFEAIQNPNIAVGGGAGIQSAQLMADKGVETVLTGNCGPNAFRVFDSAGVKVVVGVSGRVRDAVDRYKQGAFAASLGANVASHFGAGAADALPDPGMGGGGAGPGMGGGRSIDGGRGMGRGMRHGIKMGGSGRWIAGGVGKAGSGPASIEPGTSSGKASLDGEIASLREQAQLVESRLREVNKRIAELEEGAPLSALVAFVDPLRCVACGTCRSACPVEAISMSKTATVHREACTGCGRCVIQCPQGALSLHKR